VSYADADGVSIAYCVRGDGVGFLVPRMGRRQHRFDEITESDRVDESRKFGDVIADDHVPPSAIA
jgi:hypothetical protein